MDVDNPGRKNIGEPSHASSVDSDTAAAKDAEAFKLTIIEGQLGLIKQLKESTDLSAVNGDLIVRVGKPSWNPGRTNRDIATVDIQRAVTQVDTQPNRSTIHVDRRAIGNDRSVLDCLSG